MRYSVQCASLNFIFSTKAFRGVLQAAALTRSSVEPSVFVKSLHIRRKLVFYLDSPPNDVTKGTHDNFQNGPLGHMNCHPSDFLSSIWRAGIFSCFFFQGVQNCIQIILYKRTVFAALLAVISLL